MWSLDAFHTTGIFLCSIPGIISATSQRLIFYTKFSPQHVNPCPLETYCRGFSKLFRLGFIFLNKLKIKGVKQVTSSDQATAQGHTGQRYCLLHIVVQGSGSFPGWSIFLYNVRFCSYGAHFFAYFPIQNA